MIYFSNSSVVQLKKEAVIYMHVLLLKFLVIICPDLNELNNEALDPSLFIISIFINQTKQY